MGIINKEQLRKIKNIIGEWYFEDSDNKKAYSGWDLRKLNNLLEKLL